MNALVTHTNRISADTFGDLAEVAPGRTLSAHAPVLATPSVWAVAVAVNAVAFHAGYMVGIARNMAEGTHPVQQ